MLNFVHFGTVDHIAIAVNNLDDAISYHENVLGYQLDCTQETLGKHSGMRSAVLFSGTFSIVLLMSTSPNSQIAKYIAKYGTGIQHIAYAVNNIENVHKDLLSKGMEFSTSILSSSGLKQVFSKRDENTGMMYEFIERDGNFNFEEDNINKLFEQLESSDLF